MIPSQMFALGDGDSEYDIPYSLRLRSNVSGNLSKVFGTPTNQDKWTLSMWVKRGSLSAAMDLLSDYLSGSDRAYIGFNANNQIVIDDYNTAGQRCLLTSTPLYRDVSAYYNIIIAFDITLAPSTEQIKVYVNAIRVPLTGTYYANNSSNNFNYTGRTHRFGGGVAGYFDGYLSEINFIDGQQLTPTSFGQYSKDSGQWTPIKYSGTYGQNGFYLDFKDFSAVANLGYDKSGQSNHWTPNNVSLTAGATYDSMIDTPTNNFPILNQLEVAAVGVATFSNGDLKITAVGTNVSPSAMASMAGIGSMKYYVEFYIDNVVSSSTLNHCGIGGELAKPGFQIGNFSYYRQDGVIDTTPYATYTTGDVIAAAVDCAAGTIDWYKNNVLIAHRVGFSFKYYRPMAMASGTNPGSLSVNFGQKPFVYTPPSGYDKLCAKNLPTPSIKRGETGFDVATWTGNGGNIQIGEYQFPRPSYLIDKSLRFKGVNSYLSRTPVSAGNQTKWTWSGWVKASTIGQLTVFEAGKSNTYPDYTGIDLLTGQIRLVHDINGSVLWQLVSTRLLLENSNWQHILVIYDSTQATVSNRVLIYIHGSLVALTGTYPTQNSTTYINSAFAHIHGASHVGASLGTYLNGYLAEVNFIDGQALDPTSFGQFDANGYWIPKAYVGTYGQNGFYLDFEDTSAVANLGFDKSGLGNNWSVNNISLTAGVTYDSMLDSPTQNYATTDAKAAYLNGGSITEGGLKLTSSQWLQVKATFGVKSGKWYWETSHTAYDQSIHGICDNTFILGGTNSIGAAATGWSASYNQTGARWVNGVVTALWGATFTIGDIIGWALDMVNGSLQVYKNGVLVGTLVSELLDRGTIYPAFSVANNANIFINFGQRPFAYTPPVDFNPLTLSNLAEYTEDLEFPDLVWIKCRNAAQNHMLFDSVRGAAKYLSSNLTAAEATDVNSLISFNKNGFYLGNNANVNTLNNTYAAWMWKANQVEVTNNAGSIESQVRANPDIGFSIARITGSASGGTFGHGLGIKPDFIISKVRNNGSALFWVYHKDYPTGYGYFNFNNAFTTSGAAGVWGNNTAVVAPTANIITIGSSVTYSSAASDIINYCFAEVEGFSKFGSYTGNGSADGPFIYCGFKPRWIMVKNISAAESSYPWGIIDTMRDVYNAAGSDLGAAEASLESAGSLPIDVLSNGFKFRGTSENASGNNYIFAAFAECPFKYSPAR